MTIPMIQVDAFTSVPFGGNPAAVCMLKDAPDRDWMQAVAAEMNLSETAFLWPRGDGYAIRYFTPTVEVALCGHATLASAHVLYESSCVQATETLVLEASIERIEAHRDGDLIAFGFPAYRTEPCAIPDWVPTVLGARACAAARGVLGGLLVELESESELRALAPDFPALARAEGGVVVTSPSEDPRYDFCSRCFFPGSGIDEDPVTGAAHTALAPYWAERLGRNRLLGHQVSRRGGVVRVRLQGNRVEIAGQAVTILRGELCAPSS